MATVAFSLTMLGGVFFRYVLNRSLTWSDEVSLIFFIWATLLAIASGYLHDKHVNLDLIVRKLPPDWKAGVSVLAEGLTLGYLMSLTVSSFQIPFGTEGFRTGSKSAESTKRCWGNSSRPLRRSTPLFPWPSA